MNRIIIHFVTWTSLVHGFRVKRNDTRKRLAMRIKINGLGLGDTSKL